MFNENSLDTICGTLCYALGIDRPKFANDKNPELATYIDQAFGGKKVDRLIMFNPDAVAEWIFDKYPELVDGVTRHDCKEIKLKTVMPSVTPVCFATMYTGAQPDVHGIKFYTKPVLKIETLFDALIKAGKKVAIISQDECSVSKIFLERDMDYFIYPTIEETNAKAYELIAKDVYDVLIVYNTNYDFIMHKNGTEHFRSLAELRNNASTFSTIYHMIKNLWQDKHDTLLGFAMDHGCHDIDGNAGSHGLEMPEDINIKHSYVAIPKK